MRNSQSSAIFLLRFSPRRTSTQYPHSLLAIRTNILSTDENPFVLEGSPLQVSSRYGR
jgi:hypothetical protein